MLLPQLFGYIVPHAVFVHQNRVQRVAVVELEPLQLFIECLRVLQLQRPPHMGTVELFEIVPVGKAVVKAAIRQYAGPIGRVGQKPPQFLYKPFCACQ